MVDMITLKFHNIKYDYLFYQLSIMFWKLLLNSIIYEMG